MKAGAANLTKTNANLRPPIVAEIKLASLLSCALPVQVATLSLGLPSQLLSQLRPPLPLNPLVEVEHPLSALTVHNMVLRTNVSFVATRAKTHIVGGRVVLRGRAAAAILGDTRNHGADSVNIRS